MSPIPSWFLSSCSIYFESGVLTSLNVLVELSVSPFSVRLLHVERRFSVLRCIHVYGGSIFLMD